MMQMKRKGRVVASLLFTLVALACFSLAAQAALRTPSNPAKTPTTTYTVHQGDTLFAIAAKFDPNADARKIVWEIEQANHISDQTDLIQPGQSITVPVGGK